MINCGCPRRRRLHGPTIDIWTPRFQEKKGRSRSCSSSVSPPSLRSSPDSGRTAPRAKRRRVDDDESATSPQYGKTTKPGREMLFELDDEGRMSSHFWVFCAVVALWCEREGSRQDRTGLRDCDVALRDSRGRVVFSSWSTLFPFLTIVSKRTCRC